MAISTAKPTTVFTYRDITLQDRLREVAREVGEKPALLMGDRSVNFHEIDQRSDRLAVHQSACPFRAWCKSYVVAEQALVGRVGRAAKEAGAANPLARPKHPV